MDLLAVVGTVALVLAAASPLAAVPPSSAAPTADSARFDVLIRNGRVIDGTGNPWFLADVAIAGDRIAAVGDLSEASAEREIDAAGKWVVPGFVDQHSHADGPYAGEEGLRSPDAGYRAAPNVVSQGVTTVAVNQDGRSPWPIADQVAALDSLGTGPNVVVLVGHGTIRRRVLGDDYRRAATEEEVAAMRRLLRQGLEEGARGLSAGLEYVPGRWATTDEVVALARELVPADGVYIEHERSSGHTPMWYWPSRHDPDPPTMLESVLEVIEIGERSGARVVTTHIKARGSDYWGAAPLLVRQIQDARDRGVRVFADQYPYNTSGSDGSTVLIPDWAFEAGLPADEAERGAGRDEEDRDYAAALARVLEDPATAADVRRDMRHEMVRRGGPRNLVVFDHPDSTLVGKSLAEIADGWGLEPVEAALRIQREGYTDRRGGARIRAFSMAESDVEAFLAAPWTATASDGGIALPGDGPVHARFYGTFPRKIATYAMERGVLGVPAAVRSATGLPARILGLRDRGLLREGYRADVAVLDPSRLAARATFFEPHRHAAGVDHVLVNGVFVVDGGERTGGLPGRVLTRSRTETATAAARPR